MSSVLLGFGLGIIFLIARANTPRKRQIRARRRAERQRVFDLAQLSKDCHAIYSNALLETPQLRYYQDVRWIEWHSKLADPYCDDPGPRPVLSLEQITNDVPMSRSAAGRFVLGYSSSYRHVEHRRRLEEQAS